VWLTNGQVNAYTGPGPLLTDDHPLSEYFLLHGAGLFPNDQYGGFEGPALELVLVISVLLGLLVLGLVVDGLRRRWRVPPL
jgi:hypothetical protein